MKPETEQLVRKSARAILAAETLLRDSDVDFAASRAYYSIFYAAEALLSEHDLRFHKHGGVHAAFGEHFARTGKIDPKFHRWILDAFDTRLHGDYGFEANITTEDVSDMLSRATELLEAVQRLLRMRD